VGEKNHLIHSAICFNNRFRARVASASVKIPAIESVVIASARFWYLLASFKPGIWLFSGRHKAPNETLILSLIYYTSI
jgi:hypothetical protein